MTTDADLSALPGDTSLSVTASKFTRSKTEWVSEVSIGPRPDLHHNRFSTTRTINEGAPTVTYGRHHVRTVLITEPADVVGEALIARLRRAPGRRRLVTIGLGDDHQPAAAPDHTIGCRADAPEFGAAPVDYRAAVSLVDVVVHIARRPAGTPAGQGHDALREVIDFARRADAGLVYVSTAFPDDPVTGPLGPPSPVTENQLLADSGVRHVVIRTSLVTGAIEPSEDRSGAPDDTVRMLSALLEPAESRERSFAGHRLDVVPVDIVADAIVRLIDHGVSSGEFWLTAGEQALTLGSAIRLLRGQGHAIARASRPDAGFDPDRLAERVLQCRPLESSLGDRFVTALSELGALGLAPLPDARDTLLRALGLAPRRTLIEADVTR